jgi:glycosyltransferase 2 family protein
MVGVSARLSPEKTVSGCWQAARTLYRRSLEIAPGMPSWIRVGIKVAISGALISYLVHACDGATVLGRLAHARLDALVAAIVILAAVLAIQAVRWNRVKAALGAHSRLWDDYRILLTTTFIGQAMPGSLGVDALRIWYAAEDMGAARATESVLVDRVLSVLAVTLAIACCLPLYAELVPVPAAVTGIAVLAAAFLVGFLVLAWTPASLAAALSPRLAGAGERLAAVRRESMRVRPAATALALSLAAYVLAATAVHAIARGVSVDLALFHCLLLVPPVLLIASCPISVAGWGVREGALVVALGWVGVEPGAALAVSVLFGVLTLVSLLPGALLWMLARRSRTRPELRGAS